MGTGLILSLVWTFYSVSVFSFSFLLRIPLILLITVITAGIGKLAGILYAKHKYKVLSDQLNEYVKNQKMEEDPTLCQEYGLE